MKVGEVTPLVLTWNEEANIGRCLGRLAWAHRVLVLDSGSTDRTLGICAGFGNVEVVHRPFDTFARQCNFGLGQVRTAWVLSLDADYRVPEDLPSVMAGLGTEAAGYRFPFAYCVHGRRLRGSLYPPRTILYRRNAARYEDDGHGHRVCVEGDVEDVRATVLHDDRKPLERWLEAQRRYAVLEADKLLSGRGVGVADRVRRWIVPAAPAAFVHTLLVKGLILDGWPGWYYVLQRTYAELLLSLELLERRLGGKE